ncbi:hypothetical protein FACS1894172_10010 [Spirochaetia bacterium]|nr:hypothetical protein FACS1894164_20330 [Spirochaetia bacterium]GHU32769.1 hypothetical protein FACS1894172_10010 [Spirochaetia bacterium]
MLYTILAKSIIKIGKDMDQFMAGFNRLSEERKSEILGMVEAFTFAQKEEVTGAIPDLGDRPRIPFPANEIVRTDLRI